MNKKIKLISSLACLCLALCVLVYGVFAASQITYTINNTVKYQMTDVLVKVARKVDVLLTTELTVPTTAANVSTAIDEKTWAVSVAESSFQTYNASGVKVDPEAGTNQTLNADKDTITDALNFDFNTGYLYRVTITVSTIASDGIKATFTEPTASSNNNTFFLKDTDSTLTSDATIAKNTNKTYIYYIGILDNTQAIASNTEVNTLSIAFTKAV